MHYTAHRILSPCAAGERNTKSQTPSSREIPESKHQKPSCKHQRNPKFQAPNRGPRFELGTWSLELLWSLVFGVWSFNCRKDFPSRPSPWGEVRVRGKYSVEHAKCSIPQGLLSMGRTSHDSPGNYFPPCFSNPRKSESDSCGAVTALRSSQKRRNKKTMGHIM